MELRGALEVSPVTSNPVTQVSFQQDELAVGKGMIENFMHTVPMPGAIFEGLEFFGRFKDGSEIPSTIAAIQLEVPTFVTESEDSVSVPE